MSSITKEQAKMAISHANGLLDKFDAETPNAVYHVGDHTRDMRVWGQRIGYGEGLNPSALLELDVGLSYHEVGLANKGFLHKKSERNQLLYDGHEGRGVKIMTAFCRSLGFTEGALKRIGSAIAGTELGKDRETLYGQIAHDTDVSVLGRPEGIMWGERLRQESLLNKDTSTLYDAAQNHNLWAEQQIKFYNWHKWETDTAKLLFDDQKQLNLAYYKNQLGIKL